MSTQTYSDEGLNDLSDYFHGAPIGLRMTALDGSIARANLAELKLFGYDGREAEYLGRHVGELHEDPDAAVALLERVVGGERVVEHDTTMIRRDGRPQKVLTYANARIENGQLVGARWFTFPHPDDLRPDIAEIAALTDQSIETRGIQLSPAERRALYAELRDFFDNGPVNLHIVGGDGLIKHANKSELAAMGYDAESYIGKHIAGFHAEQKVIDGMLEDLVGGTPLINFGATLFHKDGSKLPVMIYSNSRMRDGSFINTRCFTVNVPRSRPAADARLEFAWPRNEDFGFTIAGREAPKVTNPMTVALKYIASRKRPEESLGFLAEVSKTLARPARLRDQLVETAMLATPFLADFVGINLEPMTALHTAIPELRDRLGDITDCAASLEPQAGCLDLDAVPDPRAARMRALGLHSALAVPIDVRGERAGTLLILRANLSSRRKLGPADCALAEELARRIGFAVEIDRLAHPTTR